MQSADEYLRLNKIGSATSICIFRDVAEPIYIFVAKTSDGYDFVQRRKLTNCAAIFLAMLFYKRLG